MTGYAVQITFCQEQIRKKPCANFDKIRGFFHTFNIFYYYYYFFLEVFICTEKAPFWSFDIKPPGKKNISTKSRTLLCT